MRNVVITTGETFFCNKEWFVGSWGGWRIFRRPHETQNRRKCHLLFIGILCQLLKEPHKKISFPVPSHLKTTGSDWLLVEVFASFTVEERGLPPLRRSSSTPDSAFINLCKISGGNDRWLHNVGTLGSSSHPAPIINSKDDRFRIFR